MARTYQYTKSSGGEVKMIILRLSVKQNNSWVTKYIWEIMDPEFNWGSLSLDNQLKRAYENKMLPTSYKVTGETYCKDADRTANYELEKITNINYKSKPEFNWSLLKAEYFSNLLTFIQFRDNYKDQNNEIVPEEAPTIKVTFRDLLQERTIEAYLGQTIDATFKEYDNVLYVEDIRIAFPER